MSDEALKQRRRRSPAEKAFDARIDRCRAEVREKHPDADELVFSLWAAEIYVAAWRDGRCIGNYAYMEEEDE